MKLPRRRGRAALVLSGEAMRIPRDRAAAVAFIVSNVAGATHWETMDTWVEDEGLHEVLRKIGLIYSSNGTAWTTGEENWWVANLAPVLPSGGHANVTSGIERDLDALAHTAFELFRADAPADRALAVAQAVGAAAARRGIPTETLSRWLQGAYGRVWVRLGDLNPGLDMKEVQRALQAAHTSTSARLVRRPLRGPS